MTKELDERFSFGPPPIQTAEDAVYAFLRKEITEDEFRAACGKYGVLPGTLFNPHSAKVERVDAAYEQQIPEDMFAPEPEETTLEDRLKMVDEKQKERDKATKEAGLPTHEVKENQKLPEATTVKTSK
jgi:hypothetical protein